LLGGAGGKGVWGKPGSELGETGVCSDARDPNYDSDSQVTVQNVTVVTASSAYNIQKFPIFKDISRLGC